MIPGVGTVNHAVHTARIGKLVAINRKVGEYCDRQERASVGGRREVYTADGANYTRRLLAATRVP